MAKYWVCGSQQLAAAAGLVLYLLLMMRGCCQGEVISIFEESEEGEKNDNRSAACTRGDGNYKSVLGDGGMREERVRVGLESWNFCNKVGNEGPNLPSPRYADCSNLLCSSSPSTTPQHQSESCQAEHLVKGADNELKSGQAFPQGDFIDYEQPDEYAIQKELYLASLCETKSETGRPWHFWMIMLKNGNFDVNSGLCPSTAPPSRPFTLYHHHQSQISTHAVSKDLFPRSKLQHPRLPQEDQGSFPPVDAHPSQESYTQTDVEAKGSAPRRFMPQHSHTSTNAKDVGPFPHFSHESTNVEELKGSFPPHISHQPPLVLTTAKAKGSFPCFGAGCMNHPRIFHNWSTIQGSTCVNDSSAECNEWETFTPTLSGSFYGTYDLEEDSLDNQTISPNSSYFSVDWSKDAQSGSWLFHHVLRVNHKYPWLMLYLRADATQGFSGGYPWETRGMMVKVPESPNFKVKVTLNVLRGGGSASQFYLLDIGGCWKNDGTPCDGNTSTDVTRYSEMIINPSTDNWCKPNALSLCPPYHVDAKTKRRIYRNDTAHFPYAAYHLYCAPPNAQFAERPYGVCDPYSNPQPQELMQLLPHPEWAVHGYPSTKGQGWVGDPTTWTLDVGGLSQRLYFYQDPNTTPAPRKWTSIDLGTEIYISQQAETAEWIVSDFDVLMVDKESN